MARPKVDPSARQRTAQACESCKRRKQKCNGLCPCNTCEKRKFQCIYVDRAGDEDSPAQKPSKRRATESSSVHKSSQTAEVRETSSTGSKSSPTSSRASAAISPCTNSLQRLGYRQTDPVPHARSEAEARNVIVESTAKPLQQILVPSLPPADSSKVTAFRARSASMADEEAVAYAHERMLEDHRGRFLYVGDSGTLSFVQLLRVMVESVAGPSAFTMDPTRHQMMETELSLPLSTPLTHVLPSPQTARVLIESFYLNTCGIVEICKKLRFIRQVEAVYEDPLSAERHFLCVVNLVFAIGLMLATPRPDTVEARIIDKLRSESLDRAEVFYLNARSLNDPLMDFGDCDFWNIQALLLMGVYMLTKTKRNAAFALVGMATRSAYGLGLHREEALAVFSAEEREARSAVFRSLFVVDRFLASSLGRPTAINEEDCSGDALFTDDRDTRAEGGSRPPMNLHNAWRPGASGIGATVKSCSVIGTILRQLYHRRNISTKVAREIGDVCRDWSSILPPKLCWRQTNSDPPEVSMARLYASLFYCHAILLLTRPFFLYVLRYEMSRGLQATPKSRKGFVRTERYSEACVVSCSYTIGVLHDAYEHGLFAKRNPFLIYFLFAASVVVLANDFAALHVNHAGDQSIQNAIAILTSSAEVDSQAARVLYMLTTFRDAVRKQQERRRRHGVAANQLPPFQMDTSRSDPTSGTRGGNFVPPPIPSHTQPLGASSRSSPPTQLPSLGNTFGSSLATFGTVGSHGTLLNAELHPRRSSLPMSMLTNPLIPPPSPMTSMPLEPALVPSAPPNPLSAACSPFFGASNTGSNIQGSAGANLNLPLHNLPSSQQTQHQRSSHQTNQPISLYSSQSQTRARNSIASLLEDFTIPQLTDQTSLASTAPDETINFDELWAWPPATGLGLDIGTDAPRETSPTEGQQQREGATTTSSAVQQPFHHGGGLGSDVHGPVPLFGIMEDFRL